MSAMERLRALEKAVELVAKATPGLWAQEHRRGSDSSYRTEVFDENGEAIATLTWHPKPPIYEGGMKGTSTDRAENAEAIVAAVNFIREHGSALIAELGQEVGAVAGRVETGVVQFGDDWPGVFIRGDNAMAFANALRWIAITPDDAISKAMLDGLAKTLESCNVAKNPTVRIVTSPAHTSEARDAAVMKLLDERIAAETNKTRRWALICFRDAAMRQEGGSDE